MFQENSVETFGVVFIMQRLIAFQNYGDLYVTLCSV